MMRRMLAQTLLLPALSAVCGVCLTAQTTPFDAAALLSLTRLSDPQISPDGKTVAFVAQTIDLAANKKLNAVYSVPIDGGTPLRLGDGDRPRWIPDGSKIIFDSDRSGASQMWIMWANGSSPKQLTTLPTEAGGVTVAADGKHIVFTSEVFPDCGLDEACNQKNLDAGKDAPKARIYDSLLYRHWTTWQSPRRSHIISAAFDPAALTTSELKDLTPGKRDVPPFSLGGPDDYVISPDGQEICFAMNTEEQPAASTNSDLFAVPINGSGEPRRITTNPAADQSPQYSPDGRYLAWRSQQRPGYESDRWRLLVMERATGNVTVLTDLLDRAVNSFVFSPDSRQIFFTVVDRGRQSIRVISVTGGAVQVAVSGQNTLDDMQLTKDGKTMVFTRQSGSQPVDIVRGSSSGGAPIAHAFQRRLTKRFPRKARKMRRCRRLLSSRRASTPPANIRP